MLALILGVIVLLHLQVKREAEEAAGQTDVTKSEDSAAVLTDGDETPAIPVMGAAAASGRLEENEGGGVRVIVPGEDGTDRVYVFTDVSADSWYANAVNYVVSAGLMNGEGDSGLFRPEYGILRESFATILYRFAKGVPEEPRYSFEDVQEDSWFREAVNWVANERLMTGLTPSSFGVGQYMTCEQAIIGLYRLAGEPETDGSLKDYPYAAKVSDAGRSAVDWAWKIGLITEVECVWYPTQAISRAQVALLLMRYSSMAG